MPKVGEQSFETNLAKLYCNTIQPGLAKIFHGKIQYPVVSTVHVSPFFHLVDSMPNSNFASSQMYSFEWLNHDQIWHW